VKLDLQLVDVDQTEVSADTALGTLNPEQPSQHVSFDTSVPTAMETPVMKRRNRRGSA